MAMPNNLVFVRHGESEGNIIQRAFKNGELEELPDGFLDRHDWMYRLSPEGVEQAQAAGQWLMQEMVNLPNHRQTFDNPELTSTDRVGAFFSGFYSSPYIRTRETAEHVAPCAKWLINDMLPERDWGLYNTVHPDERKEVFANTERMRELSSSRWRPDGGEALFSEVLLRFREWLDTMHRDMEGNNVVAVTHGELLWVARYALEHMLPEEWEGADKDKSQRIYNCDILWYSRVNPKRRRQTPNEPEISDYMRWRRIIRPWDEENSPFGGEWVELPGKRRFSHDELHAQVEAVEPLDVSGIKKDVK